MLKYILSFFIIAVIWPVWWVLEWPLWIPITVTSVVIGGLVMWVVIKEIRARRASKEIETALKAQAEREAQATRPDRQADIVALQGEFEQAISSLKSSRIGSRGASVALYSLPWYVIVGRPGAGKSTALRKSGLNFPFRSSRGDVSVRGVGGTRNCEWWMTREAVILDTAGRYTSEQGDRDEWFAFLDLLKRYRSRRPINGILATVSAPDLVSGVAHDASALAKEIRGRVDELQDRLGVVAPVYLVITKCDLLPGFRESFADLSDEERRQIWGFTLPARSQTNLAGQCAKNFDELVSITEQRSLRRLVEEPRMERRDRIYAFPQHFASLRESLTRFVQELSIEDAFHETPVIRGIYWSSGTQEGNPKDLIMSSVASAFGFRPPADDLTPAATEAKSYFLGDLFSKVIFPDYRLAGRSKERTRKQKLWVNAFGAVGLVMAVILVWLPLVSFTENRDLIAEGEVGVAYVEQHVAEDTVDAIRIDRLTTLRELMETLVGYQGDGEPWSLRMGLYQGDAIYPHLRDVYAATVRNQLLLPVVELEMAALDKFVMKYRGSAGDAPSDEEYDENFDRLRMYMLVTAPAVKGEPGLVEEERSWIVDYLSALWSKPLRESGDPATMTSMASVARAYTEILREQPLLAFERDATLVEQAQEVLNRSNRAESVTRALVNSVQGASLKLTSMVGARSIRNGDLRIRPAFTKDGYLKQIQPKFEAGLDEFLKAQWVVGHLEDNAESLREDEVEAVRSRYFELYLREWLTFINGIYTETPQDYIGAQALLRELTQSKPYQQLFSHIQYHTQLVDLNPEVIANDDSETGSKLLGAAASVAALRTRQKIKLDRYANPNLARLATEAAVERAMKEAGEGVDAPSTMTTDVDVTYAFLPLVEFGAKQLPSGRPSPGAPPPPPQTVPLDEYQLQLQSLRTALQRKIADPRESDALETEARAAQSSVKSMLDQVKGTWGPTLERILRPPVDLVWTLTKKGVADDIASKWCTDVAKVFDNKLSNRYPFRSTGPDVPLADFTAFFHPEQGEIWKFYDAVLKDAVIKRGDEYVLAATGSSTLGRFRPGIARYLNAVSAVGQSAFTRDLELGFEFDVLIKGSPAVREINLTIDGQSIRHRNGPETWQPLVWPGEGNRGAKLEASSSVTHAEEMREGEWGLFRLIEQGQVLESDDRRTFVVQWDMTSQGAGFIQIRIRPRGGDSPFFGPNGSHGFLKVFRTKRLAAPGSIMVDGPGCGGQ